MWELRGAEGFNYMRNQIEYMLVAGLLIGVLVYDETFLHTKRDHIPETCQVEVQSTINLPVSGSASISGLMPLSGCSPS